MSSESRQVSVTVNGFCHSSELWRDFPELVPGVLFVEGIRKNTSVGHQIAKFYAIAEF